MTEEEVKAIISILERAYDSGDWNAWNFEKELAELDKDPKFQAARQAMEEERERRGAAVRAAWGIKD